jgi:hypothetical protein
VADGGRQARYGYFFVLRPRARTFRHQTPP